MKKFKLIMVGILLGMSTMCVQAQSLGDIFGKLTGGGGDSSGSLLGNLIEGVFTKTNISLADIVGDYTSKGAAVTFKSENFLQKAGGVAAAATIESKLNPYYEKYGLNNMTMTIDDKANFTMKIKSLSLKGTVAKNEKDGTFEFNFKVMGVNLGKFTAYIEKSGSNLNVMFDATKLKSFISTVAGLTGNSMAKALGSILDSYEGACIGWRMVSTGAKSTTTTTGTTTNESTTTNGSSSSNSGSMITNGLGTLKDILKGGSSSK